MYNLVNYTILPIIIFYCNFVQRASQGELTNYMLSADYSMMKSFGIQMLFQVPVVRKTGGLADTVFDMDDPSNHEKANGYILLFFNFCSLCALDLILTNGWGYILTCKKLYILTNKDLNSSPSSVLFDKMWVCGWTDGWVSVCRWA